MLSDSNGFFFVSLRLPLSYLLYPVLTKVDIEMSHHDIQVKMSWSHSILSYINLSWLMVRGGPVKTVVHCFLCVLSNM